MVVRIQAKYYFKYELDFPDIPKVDLFIEWEQRRYEIAKEAMKGILAAPVVDGVNPNPNYKDVAKYSVKLADALIEELKESENF